MKLKDLKVNGATIGSWVEHCVDDECCDCRFASECDRLVGDGFIWRDIEDILELEVTP